MKRECNILRGRLWWMLWLFFAWLAPQQAATYVDETSNYSISLG